MAFRHDRRPVRIGPDPHPADEAGAAADGGASRGRRQGVKPPPDD